MDTFPPAHPTKSQRPRRQSELLSGRSSLRLACLPVQVQTFGNSKTGWDLVQTICLHNHIKVGYCYARHDRTAFDAYHERVGVCRDFTHLAAALCRCMNIPARYCTGFSATSAFLLIFSKAASSPLMLGIIVRGSVGSLLREAGMRRTCRFQRALARRGWLLLK
jgi:transglutaminase-like putative cysteine protease